MATTLHTEEAKRQNGIILKYFYGFYRWLAMRSSTGYKIDLSAGGTTHGPQYDDP